MSSLWVMVGIPGAGKSTWVQTHMNEIGEHVKYVSRDNIRFSIVKEDEPYFSHEKEVWNKFLEEIKDGLDKDMDVIADATHVSIASRRKLLNGLGASLKNCKVNAVVIKPPLNITLEQNKNRTGRALVPEDAILKMYKDFENPDIEEGFDKIMFYDRTNPCCKYIIIENKK